MCKNNSAVLRYSDIRKSTNDRFLNKYSDTLDWTYVNSELDKMGITDYENKNRELSLKVFDGAALSDAEKLLLNRVHWIIRLNEEYKITVEMHLPNLNML